MGEGPHIQKEGWGIGSTTLPEASPIPNPAEFRSEEETVGEGRHDGGRIKIWKGLARSFLKDSHRQPKAGESVQPEQGGGEAGRKGGRPRL